MKPVLIACALASTAIVSPSSFADVIEVDSKINKVTVYRQNGADVTRRASVMIPTGNHQIVLSGLPTTIEDPNRIRAAFDNASIKVTGIANTEIYQTSLVSDKQRELQSAIDALQIEKQALNDEISANKLQLGLLETIGKTSNDSEANYEVLKARLDLIRDNASGLYKANSALNRQASEIDGKIKTLSQELLQTGPTSKSYMRATIDVLSTAPTSTNLDMTYRVGEAFWGIQSDAQLNTVDGSIKIDTTAIIKQTSGEDWNISNLILSTTEPEIGQLPLIGSEFLSVQERSNLEELKISGSRVRRSKFDTVAPSVTLERDSLSDRGFTNVSNLLNERPAFGAPSYLGTDFDAQFEVTNEVAIPSSSNEHSIFLKSSKLSITEIPVKLAPRWNHNAFLYATSDMVGWDLRLFAPYVSLSRDGAFLGEQKWPDLLPGNETDLPFGVDPQIDVDVSELPPNEGDSGIFGSTKREEKRFLFKVTNNHEIDQIVEVFDRIPVSAHEDVKVTPLRGATKPSENDLEGKTGVIKWIKTLKPGEVWEIRHEYRITYPEKLILTRRNTR